jgi:anti-sigma factor RsiW
MSGERFHRGNANQVGTTDGARSDDGRFLGCLTETAIQGLADGTLRGPERMLADEHLMICPRCSAELAIYEGLVERLNRLADPPLPPEFTASVMAAVEHQEKVRDDKHRAVLAALPAALIAIAVLIFWAFGLNPTQRIRDVIVGATVAERVGEIALAVLQAVRVPLALGAMACLVAVLVAMSRAMTKLRMPAAVRS